MPRLLVAFPQCAFDPASGAARSTRLIGEWLAAAGWEVRSVTAAFSESRRWLTRHELVPLTGVPLPEKEDAKGWLEFSAAGVAQRTLVATREGMAHLDGPAVVELARAVREELQAFSPHVVLTYGDDALWRQLRAEAAARGAKVVYAVHNDAHPLDAFDGAHAVLAPSRWLAEHYTRQGARGLHALPPPLDTAETLALEHERVFTTFINPSPEKGRAVFLGIARALAERKSSVPLLIVEGRASAGDLLAAAERAGIDLRAMDNVMISPAVAQPREIFALTRTLLVPSLHEAAGRVVAEAQLNGIPCLVSDRGGLPETCGEGGRVFPLSDDVTLDSAATETAILPWVEEIERLANDEAHYARSVARAREAGSRFERASLLPRYVEWFAGLLGSGSVRDPRRA